MKAVIEMPMGTKYKYEYKDNKLVLDRVLNQEVPYNYGFLPGTKAADGDPKDVFIVSEGSIEPLTEVEIEVLGELMCTDNGTEDNKLIARIKGDLSYAGSYLESITDYLKTYKQGFIIKEFKKSTTN